MGAGGRTDAFHGGVINVLVFLDFIAVLFSLVKYLGQKSRLICLARSGIYIVRALVRISSP